MSKIFIVDLDGTVADDCWRRHLIDHANQDYREYHHACPGDLRINVGIFVLADLLDVPCAFLTARPEYVRTQTTEWLHRQFGISNPRLLMRPNDNRQSSVDLKRDHLKHLNTNGVLCAFDDRLDVLAMYQEYDIPTVLVNGYTSIPARPVAVDEQTPSIPDILRAGAKTFEERNAVYGETYLAFGKVMDAMYPDGLTIKAGDVDAFNRLGIFVQNTTKLCRYATSLPSSGHVDSAHDNMVYSAMLEYLTRKAKK